MTKGDDTRRSVLSSALELTSEVGLEGLTIGVLAKRVGMSKSGLYAHFEAKEALQVEVLDTAAERFAEVVVQPALRKSRGLPRVRALFANWLAWESEELPGGCPFVTASVEFDDRPGPVRDRLVEHMDNLRQTLERAIRLAVQQGHLDRSADVGQLAFGVWSIVLGYHHYSRVLQRSQARVLSNRAFRALIDSASPA